MSAIDVLYALWVAQSLVNLVVFVRLIEQIHRLEMATGIICSPD